MKPDVAAAAFAPRVACLATIAGAIRERLGEGHADISAVMTDINRLLDDSIAADGFQIRESAGRYGNVAGVIDLSAIDFAALAKRFATSGRKNTDVEQLKAAIRALLGRMIRVNRTRTDYLAAFEELIAAYNTGSRDIDELFRELVTLSRALTDEQQRHVREQLSEEELTIFDVLTRPDPGLSPAERDETKKVARQLLARVKDALVLDWRMRNEARARMRVTIEDSLENLPRAFSSDVYRRKVDAVFNHVFESYYGPGENVFTRAA